MLFQRDNYGFSALVVFRNKARLAVNVDKVTELAIITLAEHLP